MNTKISSIGNYRAIWQEKIANCHRWLLGIDKIRSNTELVTYLDSIMKPGVAKIEPDAWLRHHLDLAIRVVGDDIKRLTQITSHAWGISMNDFTGDEINKFERYLACFVILTRMASEWIAVGTERQSMNEQQQAEAKLNEQRMIEHAKTTGLLVAPPTSNSETQTSQSQCLEPAEQSEETPVDDSDEPSTRVAQEESGTLKRKRHPQDEECPQSPAENAEQCHDELPQLVPPVVRPQDCASGTPLDSQAHSSTNPVALDHSRESSTSHPTQSLPEKSQAPVVVPPVVKAKRAYKKRAKPDSTAVVPPPQQPVPAQLVSQPPPS